MFVSAHWPLLLSTPAVLCCSVSSCFPVVCTVFLVSFWLIITFFFRVNSIENECGYSHFCECVTLFGCCAFLWPLPPRLFCWFLYSFYLFIYVFLRCAEDPGSSSLPRCWVLSHSCMVILLVCSVAGDPLVASFFFFFTLFVSCCRGFSVFLFTCLLCILWWLTF